MRSGKQVWLSDCSLDCGTSRTGDGTKKLEWMSPLPFQFPHHVEQKPSVMNTGSAITSYWQGVSYHFAPRTLSSQRARFGKPVAV